MSDEKRLDRIEVKVDKVLEHQAEASATLAAQHVSLREHMRRTSLLEQELKPIKKHVDMVHGGIKFVGVFTLLAGVVQAIITLVGYFGL